MRIISRRTLREHWERHGRGDSQAPLTDWYNIVRRAEWADPDAVKRQFRSASFVGDRIVFNVAGNKYRLVVGVDYRFRTVYVKWIGSHREYDEIDVKEV
jgi:mRNA interferase HigB